MRKIDRIQQIKEIVLEKKEVEVEELSTLLDVSGATIRTDLKELELSGYVTRFHGGAKLNAIGYQEEEFSNAISLNALPHDEAKQELGVVAASLIKEKEWIFLGPGTTTYYIAKALSQRTNIHILTNNLLVANILGHNPNIQTLFLGGTIHCEGLYTLPDSIANELGNAHLSKAFFSIDGADIQGGYTLSDINVLDVFNSIVPICDETIMVVDYTKFGKRTFMKVNDLDFAQTVIINDNTPDLFKKYFEEHDTTVYTISTIDLEG